MYCTDNLLLVALLACERPSHEQPAWAPPPALAAPPPFWHGKCCRLTATPATNTLSLFTIYSLSIHFLHFFTIDFAVIC